MKRVQVILLCEDKQHSVFVYRFLKRRADPAPSSLAAACDEYRRVLP